MATGGAYARLRPCRSPMIRRPRLTVASRRGARHKTCAAGFVRSRVESGAGLCADFTREGAEPPPASIRRRQHSREDLTVSDLTFETESHASPRSVEERTALMANPGFGKVFTDHMVIARYSAGRGWHDAKVTARAPAAGSGGGRAALRPGDLRGSEGLPDRRRRRRPVPAGGQRPPLPPLGGADGHGALPEEAFIEAQRRLVEIDRAWIPDTPGGSLYLRPFMIATEVFLGVKPASEYLFVTIASAVGSYFKDPTGTVTVWLSSTSPERRPAAPARPSAAATMRRASRPRRRPRATSASRWCSSMRRSAGTSRSSAA